MQTSFTVSPLSSYLSALGLLKVVNAQLDPDARGFWQQGRFHLESKPTTEDLAEFFATSYQPSPCLTPWNKPKGGGPGFLDGQIPPAINALAGERFAEFRRVASSAAQVIPHYVKGGRVAGEEKIQAFDHLSREANSDAFAAWLKVCAVTTTDAKGKAIARYPALLGGTAGFLGTDFGTQFVSSLATAKAEHFAAAIFGAATPKVLVKTGNTLTYDPGGRGDGQQGYGIATSDTKATTANPADLILLAEGMTFFEGYAITAHQDEEGQGGTRQASFTLAVVHNSSGHPSSSWLENDGRQSEELWCPLWEEPVTFTELRDELARVAMLPLPRQLATGTDFALFASQLGRRHGLSGFARYCFPPRVGQGTKIPSLIEVFPLADEQEDRSDALASVASFASILRWRAKDPTVPNSYRHAAERVVAELEAVSGGGGSFASLLRNLVTWRRQEDLGRDDKQLSRFRFRRKELPPPWFQLLARELDGPEWRLALALATDRPYALLADVLLLLEGRLDLALVDDLQAGIGWIDREGLPPVPQPEETIPWLPPDYLAGLLLNQWRFDSHVPVEGDRTRWWELLLADRPEEAMELALQRLRIAEVVSWSWPAITGSEPQRLLHAVRVPVHPITLGRALKRG
ncbi:type I-U CRISPR-associated protein Csx17 [Synechococcus sp. CS-205]|uniref:type I-G CRISPR-associated protein Cas8g1/Csx17 n=1 Tax=Synechococcus sp. CS-205 TaxID=2847984 RepID=UPI00223C1817|nr:type I-U CRISPR-associated protein Csx17 [Synechococcus sp. CS-205]MCT0247872.1 type I-U CRISPR-associated protein Csx17 [Synechococcus sp. CS-205]